jgi:hypothetical protein
MVFFFLRKKKKRYCFTYIQKIEDCVVVVQAIKIDNLIENSILPIAFKKRKKVIPVLGFFEDPNIGNFTSPKIPIL